MFRTIVSVVVVLSLFVSSAESASLSNVQGAVSVSTGHGFLPVSDGAVLAPGTIVRTDEGAAVSIVYENGCSVPLGSRQQMAVLEAPPPCQAPAFDFSGAFGDISVGDILIGIAVIGSLIAIIVASSVSTKSKGRS